MAKAVAAAPSRDFSATRWSQTKPAPRRALWLSGTSLEIAKDPPFTGAAPRIPAAGDKAVAFSQRSPPVQNGPARGLRAEQSVEIALHPGWKVAGSWRWPDRSPRRSCPASPQ